MIYAILDSSGRCINRIVLSEGAQWQPPAGHTLAADPDNNYAIWREPEPEQLPEPNWQEFRRALRDENGYGAAFREALLADPMAGVQLAIGLDRFRSTGDHSDFLEALVSALAAIAPADAAHIAVELLALASRCNMPADFLAALQAMLPD